MIRSWVKEYADPDCDWGVLTQEELVAIERGFFVEEVVTLADWDWSL